MLRRFVFAALLLSACNRPPEPPPPGDALVMRAYEVPAAYAPELASVVNRLLWRGQNEPRLGNAETGPGGILLVSAPAGVQTGVEQIVSRLHDAPPAPPAPPPTVELTYWAVAGSPAPATTVPAALDEIKPALDAVAKAEGPRAFTYMEKLRARAIGGEQVKVQGNYLAVNQIASAGGGKVTASLLSVETPVLEEISSRVVDRGSGGFLSFGLGLRAFSSRFSGVAAARSIGALELLMLGRFEPIGALHHHPVLELDAGPDEGEELGSIEATPARHRRDHQLVGHRGAGRA